VSAVGPDQTVTATPNPLSQWSHFKPSQRGQLRLSRPPATITVVATSESGTHLVQFKTRPAPAGDFAALANQLLAVDGVVGVELRR